MLALIVIQEAELMINIINMKLILIIGLYLFISGNLFSQSEISINEGKISFISSQNVYARFSSTENINPGDTLFSLNNKEYKPILIVNSLSSISCVCSPIGADSIKTDDKVYHFFKIERRAKENPSVIAFPVEEITLINQGNSDSASNKPTIKKNNIRGKFAITSYAGMASASNNNFLRMRYSSAFSIDNISNSKFSFDSYIRFTHKDDNFNEIKNNIFEGLKIYSLSLKYDVSPKTSISIGRKYNQHIANIGAVDGIQLNHKIGNYKFGIIAGSKPDLFDYGFNPSLLQFGAYAAHSSKLNNKLFSTSFAFMQQMNNSKTDRRFIYLQHSNMLINKLYSFASMEVDLYKVTNGNSSSSFNFTSIYFLLRYNLTKKITVTGSYDMRNNVIYYETYKNYLDRLIEQETRQGFSANINWRMGKWGHLNLRGTYRFRKDDSNPTENLAGNLYFYKSPVEDLKISLSANYIRASYVRGFAAGSRFTYDLIPAKLSAYYYYRIFIGTYYFSELRSLQHINELQLNYRIQKKLNLILSYEAQIENKIVDQRLYLGLTKRI